MDRKSAESNIFRAFTMHNLQENQKIPSIIQYGFGNFTQSEVTKKLDKYIEEIR
jgi:hypothetical protein